MCLGFTGGVMIAASFWSLLSPAIAAVEKQQELGITNLPVWFAPAVGFLLGALFLYYLDKKIPHLHLFEPVENAEGPKTDLKKTELLVLAIALHNIPEGLAVGVAFGALAHGMNVELKLEVLLLILVWEFKNRRICCFNTLKEQGFFKVKVMIEIDVCYSRTNICSCWCSNCNIGIPNTSYAWHLCWSYDFIVIEEVVPESQREEYDIASLGLIEVYNYDVSGYCSRMVN